MTIVELKQEIERLTSETRSLLDEKKINESKVKMEELRGLKESLKIQQELEEEEKRDLENQNQSEKEVRNVDKNLECRALVKAMLGKNLTEEERKVITDGNFNSNTFAIIPSEFIDKVMLLREGYKSLKDYCDVIEVESDNGKMPIASLNDELADLEEDTAMIETMLDTKEIPFKVKDKGLLKKVGNNLLEDSPVSFINGVLAPNFAVASINKENKEICSVVATSAKSVTVGADAKVEDVLANTISKEVPAVRSGLVIITNNEGYAYLDNLKDASTNAKHKDISYDGDTLYFKHKEVIEMSDKLLPALTSGKKIVFYVVNLKTVPFFDRKQIEIAKSTEAGFIANKTLIRAIERFDVVANPEVIAKPKKIEA